MVNEAILDTQQLAVRKLIELYEIKMINGTTFYLTPDINTDEQGVHSNLIVGNRTYTAIPMQIEDITFEVQSSPPRPILTISNVFDFIDEGTNGSNFLLDIIGAKVTKRTTFKKYIDRFNNQPHQEGVLESFDIENNLVQLPKHKFIVDRISNKNIVSISFELSSAFDLDTIKLPGRIIAGGYCPFVYKGAAAYISESKKIGGCTWTNKAEVEGVQNDNEYTESLPIFMTVVDEYIIQDGTHFYEIEPGNSGEPQFSEGNIENISLVAIADLEDIDIEKNRYYKTAVSLDQVNKDGSITTVSGYDYWQALSDIGTALTGVSVTAKHYPSDTSKYWRRVRVWNYYDSERTYRAYVDGNRNEYVYVHRPLQVFEDESGVASKLIKVAQESRTAIALAGGTSAIVCSFNIDKYLSQELNVTGAVVYDKNRIPLTKILANEDEDTAYGLTNTNEYVIKTQNVIVNEVNTVITRVFTLRNDSFYYLGFADDSSSPYTEPLTNNNLFQVKSVTQVAANHFAFPGNNNIWRAGDVCGKALTSCSMRFGVEAHSHDAEDIPNFTREVIGSEYVPITRIPFQFGRINLGTRGVNSWKLLEDQWLSIPDKQGYVVAFLPLLLPSKVESAVEADDPLVLTEALPDDDSVSLYSGTHRYNLSTLTGDFRLQLQGVGGGDPDDLWTAADSIYKDFFGVSVDGAPPVSPLPYSAAVTIKNDCYLEPIVLAYDKGDSHTEGVQFYRIPTNTLSYLTPQTNYPTPEAMVTLGQLITLPSGNDSYVANYKLNNNILRDDDTVLISSSTEIRRNDNYAFSAMGSRDLAHSFYLDFNALDGTNPARAFYIATETRPTVPLPFGGFPGTRKYN